MAVTIPLALALCLCALSAPAVSAASHSLSSSRKASAAAGEFTLRVSAHYPMTELPGSAVLFLRGNCSALGLNWTSGMYMQKDGDTSTVEISYSRAAAAQCGNGLSLKTLGDDKVWQIGANVAVSLPVDGSQPVQEVNLYPWFFAEKGTIELHRNIFSPQFKDYRDVIVYLPPSYYENTLKVQDQGSLAFVFLGSVSPRYLPLFFSLSQP
jgi:hypothetical protein